MPKKDAAGRSMSLTSQESYSAVIIADLVAEVPTPDDPAPPDVKGSSRLNPAFEPPTSPAVVDVELEEKGGGAKRNGADISKGVILNVTAQFGHDKLAPDPAKLRAPSPDPDFRSMSLPRKIAFGFSFLPSIMFVLCFAVILPCKEQLPCVQRVWSSVMPDTEVTSKLWVSNDRLAFLLQKMSSGHGSVSSLDSKSGDIAWTKVLQAPSSFIQCDKLNAQDSESCLVAQNSAIISLFNLSDGSLLWKQDDLAEEGVVPASFPAVLPECGDGENVSRVAMGLSRAQIKVLSLGAHLRTVNVSGCESVPFLLTPWKKENDTDLLFACRHGDKESFMKLPESQWCPSKKKTKENVITMHTMSFNDLEKSVILPTKKGLLLWAKDQILMFDSDGQKLWSKSTSPHSVTNRFLLFGKFNATGSQVALFSSSLQGNLTVSTYDSSSGELGWLKEEPNSQVSDVALVHGKDKDFAVVSMQKAAPGTLASEALSTIGVVSSTLASVLTLEEVSAPKEGDTPSVSADLAFLDFSDEFIKPVHKLPQGGVVTIKVDPSYKTDSETISIYVLRNPENGSKEKSSLLERIDVAHWDISQTKQSSCKWKE